MPDTRAVNWTRLSTERITPGPTVGRGTAQFDADALREALHASAVGADLTAAQLGDYRAFYALEFAHLEHSHRLFSLSVDGQRVAVQHFVPAEVRGVVLLCHGYFDHVGLYGLPIEQLLRRGLAVVTYDQLGHGLSAGARATIEHFDRYVDATRVVWQHAISQFGEHHRWHWMGQSMGGAVVMETLQQLGMGEADCGVIVLLAPLTRPYAWWLNRWLFALARLTIEARPRRLTNNAENPEFHALQAVDPLQPRILPVAWVAAMVAWSSRFTRYPRSDLGPVLVQGDADRTVDWRFTLKTYRRRYPASTFVMIPGGKHHLANESAGIQRQIWSALDTHCRW